MTRYVGTKVSQDFIPVVNVLNLLCNEMNLNKSKVLREAIRKEVKILLNKNKGNPDVAELIKNSTDAQMVFMNFNPHYVKNLN